MKKLALAIAMVSAASASQAAVYNLTDYSLKNNYTGGAYFSQAVTISGTTDILGPVFTVTGVSVTTGGGFGISYTGGTWIFNAIAGTLESIGGTCVGSANACAGPFTAGTYTFSSDAFGLVPVFNLTGLQSPVSPGNQQRFTFTEAPAVPVPAAAWLMGSGLVGLAGIARRRKMA